MTQERIRTTGLKDYVNLNDTMQFLRLINKCGSSGLRAQEQVDQTERNLTEVQEQPAFHSNAYILSCGTAVHELAYGFRITFAVFSAKIVLIRC